MHGRDIVLAGLRQWKTTSKHAIFELHVAVVQSFTTLAIRLSENKRPPFAPEGGLDLASLAGRVKTLQGEEQLCDADLNAELERQWRLVRTDKHHADRHEKLKHWLHENEAYLNKKLTITASGQARNELKRLDVRVFFYPGALPVYLQSHGGCNTTPVRFAFLLIVGGF